MAEKKYVYSFEEAHKAHLGKDLLGGKGAGLAEMTAAGINIPAGFTITTAACTLYYQNGKKIPDYVWDDIVKHIHMVEKEVGKEFGGTGMPLLVSVRSGARISMPGMMDTILNLGLNDTTVEALAKAICLKEGIPYQDFSTRSDLRSGSTLASISNSRLSLPSVDLGIPMLGMHSGVEIASYSDLFWMERFAKAYFSTPISFNGLEMEIGK